MERVQRIPTNGRTKAAAYEEYAALRRCPECRGHLVELGDELTCTSCGVVARTEKTAPDIACASSATPSRRLGSYIGRKEDENSHADFNGNSTVGFAKLLSDHMGEDQTAWNCAAMIERVADKLSLPAFARENAVALSEKMLAASRSGSPGRRRTSVPAISAYSILSACRAAGLDHVGSRSVIRAHNDMGHSVTKSALLHLGTESPFPLRPADPAALLRTVLGGLESNEAVLSRLKKRGAEPGPYFRGLLQASQAVLPSLRERGEGRNPRTVAAVSVYLASQAAAPRAVMQREAAEAAGVAEYTVREFAALAGRELGPVKCGPLPAGHEREAEA
jgi:transcription initiation factor TFIIIB Brf1 subunit/transcription initiation factor TFIIB